MRILNVFNIFVYIGILYSGYLFGLFFYYFEAKFFLAIIEEFYLDFDFVFFFSCDFVFSDKVVVFFDYIVNVVLMFC